jgi:protein-tyrosine phosphatase
MRFFSNLHAKGDTAANKYILVHCTHGHNRTGFMIVHYLMRTQCNSVEQVCLSFYVLCGHDLVSTRYLS